MTEPTAAPPTESLTDPLTVPLRIRARGHPAVRATHHKSWELTTAPELGLGATCVLGVADRLPAVPVAGPLRITIGAGGESVTGTATGNSTWQPGASLVVRRSGERLPNTFATDAEVVARDLPRSLAAALADPDTELTVLVERATGPAGGTLVRWRLGPPAEVRLAAELAAADLVLAEDAGARSRLGTLAVTGTAPEGAAVLAGGGRVLSVSTARTGAPAVRGLVAAAGRVEVLGLPAELAVSAAAADDAPVLLGQDLPARELATMAAGCPGAAVVFRAPAVELSDRLSALGRSDSELVVVRAADPERPVRGRLSEIELAPRADVLCRAAASAAAGSAEPPVAAAALVAGLLAQSVTPRTIALALAGLPGWSRKRAYDFVLSLTGSV